MEPAEVEITVVHGEVPDSTKERARDKIARLERLAPRPFLFARVRFDRPSTRQSTDPPVYVQGQLDVDGRMVQTSTLADHPDEAVDILEKTLREQLRRLSSRLATRRHEPRTVPEGEWRHGALPTARPGYFPRPPEDREVVPRETYAREPMRADEAAFDMEMLGYEFHLFAELDTGADAVIRRLVAEERDGGADRRLGLCLAADSQTPSLEDLAVPVRLDPPPPRLRVGEALERLDAGDERFVFFVDEATGRGSVAHYRYDGHYGLVVPNGLLTS